MTLNIDMEKRVGIKMIWWFPVTPEQEIHHLMGIRIQSDQTVDSRVYQMQMEARISELLEQVPQAADLVAELIPELAGQTWENDPTTLAAQIMQTDASQYLMNKINWDKEVTANEQSDFEMESLADETSLEDVLNLMNP